MLDFQAVGKQIHNLRVQNGFSQDGLAEVLYVTRQAVSRWELGQTLPSVDNLAELCRLFRVSFEELLCMGRPTEFAEDDLFRGHSREFVVDGIINGKLNVKLPEVLYQFSRRYFSGSPVLATSTFQINRSNVPASRISSSVS